MENIHILGSSTLAGNAFIEELKDSYPLWNLTIYSRESSNNMRIDLNNPVDFLKSTNQLEGFLISFAPIWLVSNFFEKIVATNSNKIKNLKGILLLSSSSAITKSYSINKFDKKLVSKLIKSENKISNICKTNKIICQILRPTLIYGNSQEYSDKNINVIKNYLRKMPFLILPTDSGLRQPIHARQLAKVCSKLIYDMTISLKEYCNKHPKIIALGGDDIISYNEMVKLIKKDLILSNEKIHCTLIFIPNRLFLILASLILIFSPRYYEAILRICSDLSGFKTSNYITGDKEKTFPVK